MSANGKITVAVLKELTPGERRVAVAPDGAVRLIKAGLEVVVESGAGDAAGFLDAAYEKAGARVVPGAAVALGEADLLLKVRAPSPEETGRLKPGAVVVSYLDVVRDKAALDAMVQRARAFTAVAPLGGRNNAGFMPRHEARECHAGRLSALASSGELLEQIENRGGRSGSPSTDICRSTRWLPE